MKSVFQQEIEARLAGLVEPIVVEAGGELVELQYVQRKSNALLRILVDKVGGITLDECAEISHRVAFLLEASDPFEGRYTLEVSSPGLDRPLTTRNDFRRKIGETVRLMIEQPGNRYEVTGEIVRIDDRYLFLKTTDGETSFPFDEVVRGKIIF